MKEITVCLTGHRPKDLPGGYDVDSLPNKRLIHELNKIIVSLTKRLPEEHCITMMSGMALGADTLYALSALQLRDSNYKVKLHLAIPHTTQSDAWFKPEDKNRYKMFIEQADFVDYVFNGPYEENKKSLTERNIYMVDHSDMVIAIFNHEKFNYSSGTAHCLRYAIRQGKNIICINPVTYQVYNLSNNEAIRKLLVK